MSLYYLKHLDRDEYIASVATIQDSKTVKFANMSLAWWDEHLIWFKQGCVVLCDAEQNHLCYVFYKIDRYKEYMNVHNIFTPLAERRKGYAYALLSMIFDHALEQKVKRFKLTSISKSLDFYLSLGFVYWGVNSVGDYYCDLPIPTEGLGSLDAMVQNSNTLELMDRAASVIHKKTDGNASRLSARQNLIYESDLAKMGESYMHAAFQETQLHS